MELLLMDAIRHENLKPPEFPFDPARYHRAAHFADRVMKVIAPYCARPGTAFSALVAAGYLANVQLSVDE